MLCGKSIVAPSNDCGKHQATIIAQCDVTLCSLLTLLGAMRAAQFTWCVAWCIAAKP